MNAGQYPIGLEFSRQGGLSHLVNCHVMAYESIYCTSIGPRTVG